MKDISLKIIRGEGFKKLKADPAFGLLLQEWQETIERHKNLVLTFRSTAVSCDAAIPYWLYRYQGLQELLDWFEECIEDGEQAAIEYAEKVSQ